MQICHEQLSRRFVAGAFEMTGKMYQVALRDGRKIGSPGIKRRMRLSAFSNLPLCQGALGLQNQLRAAMPSSKELNLAVNRSPA